MLWSGPISLVLIMSRIYSRKEVNTFYFYNFSIQNISENCFPQIQYFKQFHLFIKEIIFLRLILFYTSLRPILKIRDFILYEVNTGTYQSKLGDIQTKYNSNFCCILRNVYKTFWIIREIFLLSTLRSLWLIKICKDFQKSIF